jgi:hypothetical protein
MHARETVTLPDDPEQCVAQLLRLAQSKARQAQVGAGSRMQDALAELEDAIGDQIGALEIAAEADRADLEDSPEGDHLLRSWRPMRAA